MASMAATSSVVWPSIAARSRTSRSFGESSSRARSRCAWNSLEAAMIFGGCSRRSLRPQRFALLAALAGANTIQRKPKTDAHQPGAKAIAIAQPVKAAVGANQRFLRDVFGVRIVAQHAASYAIGQRAALREQRSSNSRRVAALAASFAHSRSAALPGWIRTSSCIGSCVRAGSARPPRTTARRRGQ